MDLDCQPASISAQQVDESTMMASGCGKRAIYVEHCNGSDRTDCTWMLNSEIKPTAGH